MKIIIEKQAIDSVEKSRAGDFLDALKSLEKLIEVPGGSVRLNRSPLEGHQEFLHDKIMITGKVNLRRSAFVVSYMKDISENTREFKPEKSFGHAKDDYELEF